MVGGGGVIHDMMPHFFFIVVSQRHTFPMGSVKNYLWSFFEESSVVRRRNLVGREFPVGQ